MRVKVLRLTVFQEAGQGLQDHMHSYLWEFRRHLGNAKTASQIQSKLKIALATDKQKLFLSVDGSARQM